MPNIKSDPDPGSGNLARVVREKVPGTRKRRMREASNLEETMKATPQALPLNSDRRLCLSHGCYGRVPSSLAKRERCAAGSNADSDSRCAIER